MSLVIFNRCDVVFVSGCRVTEWYWVFVCVDFLKGWDTSLYCVRMGCDRLLWGVGPYLIPIVEGVL